MRIGGFIITLCFIGSLHAQSFVKGFGFFGSGTSSKHEYTNTDTDKKSDTSALASYFYPQTHISKERFSWGAGVFVELGKEKLRWQTELSYINKGAKEMPFAAPGFFYTGDRTGTYLANKTTYIEWNNFLKFYYPLGGDAHWYVMPGIRLEYLFKQVTPVFADFAGTFPKIWFSGDLGLGYEFPIVRRFNGFIEAHWNPDIIPHKQANTRIRSRTFELRAGIVIRPRKRRIDDCNAPRYRGPEF